MVSSMQAPNRGSSEDREKKDLEQQVESLERQLQRALAEIERLRKQLEEALRANKRGAAPFSKGEPKLNPKPPGRKSGVAYGQQARRPIPSRVDEPIPVALPPSCPDCDGPVILHHTQPQYQEDIIRMTVIRRFDVEIGTCLDCGRQVQGRHPLQTSDSLRVGEVQVGPEALSMAAVLNKELGLSHQRTARVLELGYGLKWSRSGICRALERLGNLARPTYQQLQSTLRRNRVVWLDDTGWRVDARPQNLRVLLSEQVTVYVIEAHRGYAEAAAILGEDYAGFLVHDGARCFYGFAQAFHQSCLEHLIRRCREMIALASSAAAQFPWAIKALLQQSLRLRNRYQEREISRQGLAVATGRLEARLDRMLDHHFRNPDNQRLARHLRHEQPHLFTFLHCPSLHATNNFAERAIRLMAMARKTWGGNRTWNGARTQQILASVLRTCWQQGQDAFAQLVKLLRSARPIVLEIVPDALSP
jgi:transposase